MPTNELLAEIEWLRERREKAEGLLKLLGELVTIETDYQKGSEIHFSTSTDWHKLIYQAEAFLNPPAPEPQADRFKVAEAQERQRIWKELGTLKWIGADEGWEKAISAVREYLFKEGLAKELSTPNPPAPEAGQTGWRKVTKNYEGGGSMKEYKKTYCIEGDYFTCPETVPPIVEEPDKEGIISQELPLSTDNYKKAGVTKKSFKLYEK